MAGPSISRKSIANSSIFCTSTNSSAGCDIDPSVARRVVAGQNSFPAQEMKDVLEIGVRIDYRIAVTPFFHEIVVFPGEK